jgi:predicted dehydrogenase
MKSLNQPVNVAIVGARFGNLHASAIAEIPNKARLVAVCTKTAENAEAMAKRWKSEFWTTHFDELLAKENIHAIHLCIPHHLHAPMAIKAAKAQKHVLCEKPIAISLDEADQMIQTFKAENATLMIDHNQRFVEGHWLAQKVVQLGMIGEPFLFVAGFHHLVEAGGYRLLRQQCGGGALIDSGIHWLDLMRWIVGEVDAVFGLGGKYVKKDMEGEDTAALTLRFKNGAIGQFSCSWAVKNRKPIEPMKICGSQATLRIEEDKLYFEDRNTTLSAQELCKREPSLKPDIDLFKGKTGRDSVKLSVEHFIDCILNHKPPLVSGEEAKEALKIALAANEAMKEEKLVKVT